jgi:serine/threonine-protein kinase
LDAAIQEYRTAIDLDPKYAPPHNNLGNALAEQQQVDAAIEEYRKAIDLDPKYALPHYNSGKILGDKQQLDAAIREYRSAIDLDPKLTKAHCNLGFALREKGLFAESLAELQEGHRLGSAQPDWRYPSSRWVQGAEWLLETNRRLPAILEGKEKPVNDSERPALGWLCQRPFKKLHAASTRFYAEAFAHNPKLAEDVTKPHRYNAACSAALASCGKGEDAAKLDDQERARLRQQALDWLRADLAAWTKLADDAKQHDGIRRTLAHWQQDADLAGIRDEKELAKLHADEREACQKLWADVAELLKKVQE